MKVVVLNFMGNITRLNECDLLPTPCYARFKRVPGSYDNLENNHFSLVHTYYHGSSYWSILVNRSTVGTVYTKLYQAS